MPRMMMTSPSDTLRRCAASAWLALVLLLAGCGPGTGGTGTGPSGVFSFTGTSAAVSAPGFSTGCPGGCERVDLRLQEGRVEFLLDCRRFVFQGAWDPAAPGALTLAGTLDPAAGASGGPLSASLNLEFSGRLDEAAVVTVRLVDATGVLRGPFTLQRNAGAAAAPACGG